MERRTIGIVVNGVTGRMGYRQHLVRSLLAIREQGGLPLKDGRRLWPEPILVGRSEIKLREIAARHGLPEWSTDLSATLARPYIFFALCSRLSGIFGLPSANRSPFHSEVRKINSSFEMVCANRSL
jgi:hypothetical protein